MTNESFYVIEAIRKADGVAFMLHGTHSTDQDDSWYFDIRGAAGLEYWARLPTITVIGDHTDHNQWIVDFAIPQLRKLNEEHPAHPEVRKIQGEPFTLTMYKVDMRASLNLRFKPMVCQTFHLSGEPFVGAIKQGYTRG
ncbi:hypothetical protein [Pseudomonas phage D6]|nr:hypothetical protein [Pseudomonas phage D6]